MRKLRVVNNVDFSDPNICTSCGACCGPSEAQLGWPDVTPEEVAKVRKGMDPKQAASLLTTEPGFLAFVCTMNKQGYVTCPFLNGRIGESVSCGIYKDRPAVCREFEAGSKECREFRRMRSDSLLPAKSFGRS